MLYAKCIHESQIAHTFEEFIARQPEEYNVYCENQVTHSKYGNDALYCVPLNFIYDCLKYGNYIAIIEVDNCEEYSDSGSYQNKQIISSNQKVVRILNAYTREAIDYVFDQVNDSSLIHSGYVHWLPSELRDYFTLRKNNAR